MARSHASDADGYLAELPLERRAIVSTLRKLILKHLPRGYREAINWGMLSYGIPLARYPQTYNGQPLGYVALAAQKNNYSLYLMGAYLDPALYRRLCDAFAQAGLKLDIGKSCIRFDALNELPLEAIGRFIAGMSVDDYLARYEAVRANTVAGRKAVAKKMAVKEVAAKKVTRRTPALKKSAAKKSTPLTATRKKTAR